MSENPHFESQREAAGSIERMQTFDVALLPRENDLGSSLNFSGAINPASRLVSLYKRLSKTALEDLPLQSLRQIYERANNDYALFKQILEFDVSEQQKPQDTRNTYIKQLTDSYDPTFQILHPFISYSLHRSADFQRLDSEARATMQSISDRATKLETKLQDHEIEAQRVLDQIRAVAAEEGVTQQSIHFKNEAAYHETEAKHWRRQTTWFALGLGAYAAISIFLHKIPYLTPDNNYEAIQIAISKMLMFSVIAYMLFLSARNFLSHKHNAVVNRHRQNALMAHKALIEAASEIGIREAIMVQAAGCIFSPQGTGYSVGSGGDYYPSKSVVELLTKSVSSPD